MDKNTLIKSLHHVKEHSGKRNFKQSFDLIIALKNLDLKKPEHQIDTYATLHYTLGKKANVCGLVGAELIGQAKEVFEHSILSDDFQALGKDKKAVKKLAVQYDFFVAQGNIMAQVASAFGKALGPRGKMPNPKVGCVVPPNANLKPLYDKLQKTVRLTAKKQSVVQTAAGTEEMKEEEIADNIATIYNTLLHALPQDKNNIHKIFLKMTMGKTFRIDDKGSLLNVREENAGKKPAEAKP
jgi:large subunit ribosomal protein L1